MDSVQIFTVLLPPAILLGILAYLTKFFGRVISDQNPFADDRKYHIELSGIAFMLILIHGVIGVAAALYGPALYEYDWMHIVSLIGVAIVCAFFQFVNAVFFAKYFKLRRRTFNGVQEYDNALANFFFKAGKRFPLFIAAIILFYIGTIEYLSGDWLWVIFIWSLIFYAFTLMASCFSMRKMEERLPVDVHFTDPEREIVKGAMILKVNDDNVRLRVEDTIMIINKSEIFKLEMQVPANRLPAADQETN